VNARLKSVETGEAFDLEGVSLIGRSPECLVVLDDPRVSRRHAMVRAQDGGFYLFDLGSFNGSHLTGSRLSAARELTGGDIVTLAEDEFQFEQSGAHSDAGAAEDAMSLGGSTIALIRSTPVVILVSDIKGYTGLSESISAHQLAQIIGGWYSDCERIIAEENGSVDKFIGDCVLAYWTKVDESTLRASLRAAEKLLASCRRIYRERSDVFDTIDRSFEIGIALHTGKVAYGGMSQRESTLVGDPVNLAFRLEPLTRTLAHDVLVSGDFARNLPPELARECCRSLGVHRVRGRAQGVEVHAVTAFPPPEGDGEATE